MVSIPFDQGDVFRLERTRKNCSANVSIPFDQGDVFRRSVATGVAASVDVSIPFDQGDVFRQRLTSGERIYD